MQRVLNAAQKHGWEARRRGKFRAWLTKGDYSIDFVYNLYRVWGDFETTCEPPSPVDPQPPAEAQQDDEVEAAYRAWCSDNPERLYPSPSSFAAGWSAAQDARPRHATGQGIQ